MSKLHIPEFGAPLEHAIVRALVSQLAAAQWRPKCGTYGEGNEPLKSANEVLDFIFSVDSSCVEFTKNGAFGNVVFVCGNGEDIISDWRFEYGDPDGFSELLDTFVKQIEGAPLALVLS